MAFPDTSTVRTVLALTTCAPTACAATQWDWRVDAPTLNLHARPAGSAPGDRHAMLLGGGAKVHHAAVALASAGWRPTVRRLPDPGDPDHLAAIETAPQTPGDLDSVLAAAITRRSDPAAPARAPGWAQIALLGARAARAGVTLRLIADDPGATDADGVVVALGTEDDDDVAGLRAGEAVSLVLLSATTMGLGGRTLTGPLRCAEARAALRHDVFGGDAHPQVLLQLGGAGGETQ